jgi:hypothetical protein
LYGKRITVLQRSVTYPHLTIRNKYTPLHFLIFSVTKYLPQSKMPLTPGQQADEDLKIAIKSLAHATMFALNNPMSHVNNNDFILDVPPCGCYDEDINANADGPIWEHSCYHCIEDGWRMMEICIEEWTYEPENTYKDWIEWSNFFVHIQEQFRELIIISRCPSRYLKAAAAFRKFKLENIGKWYK